MNAGGMYLSIEPLQGSSQSCSGSNRFQAERWGGSLSRLQLTAAEPQIRTLQYVPWLPQHCCTKLMDSEHPKIPNTYWQRGCNFAQTREEVATCEAVAHRVNEKLQREGWRYSRLYIAYVVPFFFLDIAHCNTQRRRAAIHDDHVTLRVVKPKKRRYQDYFLTIHVRVLQPVRAVSCFHFKS